MLFNTAINMCSGITVEVHSKNCNFEKLQFFTVGWLSLYFLQVKNCNLSNIFHVVYFGLNECSYYKFSQLKNCKKWAKKLQINSSLQNISSKDNLLEIALGPSIYYVNTFWDFFWHTNPTSAKNGNFLTPTTFADVI